MKQEKINNEMISRFAEYTIYELCSYILNLEELVSDLKEEVSDLEQYNNTLIGNNNSLLNQLGEYKGE